MGAAQLTALSSGPSPSPPQSHVSRVFVPCHVVAVVVVVVVSVLVPGSHPMTYAKIGELQNSRRRPALPVFGPLS